MKRLIVALVVLMALLSFVSCTMSKEGGALFGEKKMAEITLLGPGGYSYLMELKVGGETAKVDLEKGKIFVDLEDGVYKAELTDTDIFEKDYTVEIKDGKGTINLEVKPGKGLGYVKVIKDGKVVDAMVVKYFGDYHALEFKFKGYGKVTVGSDGEMYYWVGNRNLLALIAPGDSKLPSVLVAAPAYPNDWKEIEGIMGYDARMNGQPVSF